MGLALRDVRFRGNADIEGPAVGHPEAVNTVPKSEAV